MKVTLKNLAFAFLVLFLTACRTVSTSQPLEYRVDHTPYGPNHAKAFEEHLNAIAREGWTLVAFNDNEGGGGIRSVSSRPRRAK